MNQLSKIAFVVGGAVLASASHAQAPAGKPATQNIVTVSFNDVVLHTAEAQKALSALQAQLAPRQAQLQALNDEVEALRKKVENTNEKASDTERATSAEALDRKEKQLQRQADDFRQDSQAESQQVFERVAQKVFAFLQAYAQEHGYSAVIERGSDASPVVWYVANNMDITEQLIKAYDGLNWSPEQISGWLKRRYPTNESMRVSHETIYRSLFIQARGVLKKELVRHLRSERLMRRSVHARAGGKSHGQIVDAISIRERPAEVEDRAIPGHWEGDLLAGTGNTHIATLVERRSRFTILVKVPSKDTATVVAALSRQVRKLPASLRRSLTWDRGLEMAKHKSFTVDTKVQVYFCDPQSPWQRGTNENTNGLLRQYFPKEINLSGYSQADLDKVALQLNQRPRKTLGFETPAGKLQASVASTH